MLTGDSTLPKLNPYAPALELEPYAPLAEFDRYAPAYSEMLDDPIRNRFARDPLHFHWRKWDLIRWLLKRTGVEAATQRWLDVGCGRGELLEMAGPNFTQAMGCDPSAGMIGPTGRFRVERQTSATALPIGDACVDFVTAVCVFHHVHGTARELLTAEIGRVLTPGGLCCILEHNPWNPATRAIVRRCPIDAEAELLAAREARAMLLLAGFEMVSTDYFLYFPEKLYGLTGSMEGVLRKVPFGGQYALLARAPA